MKGKMADIADEFNHFLHNNYHLLMWDGWWKIIATYCLLWFMLLNEWNSFDCYLRNWCVVIKKGVCFHSCLTMLVYSLHPSVQMIWEVFSGMVQLKTSLVSRMICQGWHFRDLEGFKECESSPSIPKGLGWWSVIWNSSETVQLSAQRGSGAFGNQISHVLIV